MSRRSPPTAHWTQWSESEARTALAEKVTPEDMKLELENPIISTLATRLNLVI